MKYETVVLYQGVHSGTDTVQKRINFFGEDGYRVTAVVPDRNGYSHYVYLERAIDE